MTDAIFVLNAGSSSLKFRIFGAEDSLPLLGSGRIIGIGSKPEFSVDGKIYKQFRADLSQSGALQEIIDWLKHAGKELNIIAMGHRIVHGGEDYQYRHVSRLCGALSSRSSRHSSGYDPAGASVKPYPGGLTARNLLLHQHHKMGGV